jgi:type IV pilus assembly protein PilV
LSLIEVLITMLVLGFGLLGLAMMQTLSIRYSQSANYRTQAMNLAYDLLDQVRANRALSMQFAAITSKSFDGQDGRGCSRPLAYVAPAASAERWKCQVRAALGPAAFADVVRDGTTIKVTIQWSDARNEVGVVGKDSNGQITVESQL